MKSAKVAPPLRNECPVNFSLQPELARISLINATKFTYDSGLITLSHNNGDWPLDPNISLRLKDVERYLMILKHRTVILYHNNKYLLHPPQHSSEIKIWFMKANSSVCIFQIHFAKIIIRFNQFASIIKIHVWALFLRN
jgi:hypothetical protein